MKLDEAYLEYLLASNRSGGLKPKGLRRMTWPASWDYVTPHNNIVRVRSDEAMLEEDRMFGRTGTDRSFQLTLSIEDMYNLDWTVVYPVAVPVSQGVNHVPGCYASRGCVPGCDNYDPEFDP